MSGLHLSHKLPWNDLIECLRVYKDPGIELPIGDCGKIHLDKKKTEIQLKNREYLDSHICEVSDCSTTGSKIFRKNEKHEVKLPDRGYSRGRSGVSGDKCLYFSSRLAEAMREFAETERKKIGPRHTSSIIGSSSKIEEIVNKLKAENRWVEPGVWNDYKRSCNCFLVTMLIEAGDGATLLSLSNEEIQTVLSCTHGGQAVGNNIQFLTYHIFKVYLSTNLIIGAGLEASPDKWGCMKPGSYARQDFMHDCDGQTFLYFSRRFLTDEAYMKDWEGMRQLSKNCFQFLYFLEMLRMEVNGSEWDFEGLKRSVEDSVDAVIR